MIRLVSGTPLILSELEIRGYTYTPDQGSDLTVNATDVYGATISTVISYSGGDIIIPPEAFPLAVGKPVTFYSTTISFTANGDTLTSQLKIRTEASLPIFTSLQDVRDLLGVNEMEVPDESMDLFRSYLDVRAEIPIVDLFADDEAVMKTSQLIAYREALTQLKSLGLKVLQKRQIDDHTYSRLSSIDFKALKENLEASYGALKAEFLGEETGVQLDLVTFADRTDPFTGS